MQISKEDLIKLVASKIGKVVQVTDGRATSEAVVTVDLLAQFLVTEGIITAEMTAANPNQEKH